MLNLIYESYVFTNYSLYYKSKKWTYMYNFNQKILKNVKTCFDLWGRSHASFSSYIMKH